MYIRPCMGASRRLPMQRTSAWLQSPVQILATGCHGADSVPAVRPSAKAGDDMSAVAGSQMGRGMRIVSDAEEISGTGRNTRLNDQDVFRTA